MGVARTRVPTHLHATARNSGSDYNDRSQALHHGCCLLTGVVDKHTRLPRDDDVYAQQLLVCAKAASGLVAA
jgi:hypothetical protein